MFKIVELFLKCNLKVQLIKAVYPSTKNLAICLIHTNLRYIPQWCTSQGQNLKAKAKASTLKAKVWTFEAKASTLKTNVWAFEAKA